MKLTRIIYAAILALALATGAWAQATLRSTTFSAAVGNDDETVGVASATGIEVGHLLFVRGGREIMEVRKIASTTLTVRRGQRGTPRAPYNNGDTIYVDKPEYFDITPFAEHGGCTAATEVVLPAVNVRTGDIQDCLNGVWVRITRAIVQASYTMNANASLADQTFFVANRTFQVIACRQVHSTAGSDAGAVNLQVVKDTGTDAPGAGTNLLTNNTNAGFDLKGTANTVQVGALVTTLATVRLAVGNRLAVDFAGVLTAVAGVTVSCDLAPY